MSEKSPLLLLHGALGSQDQLLPLRSVLSEVFEVHTMNFSGHGGDDCKTFDFSIDLFAEDVITYLEAQKLSKIDIFGYSMGGYVALKVADKKPELVNKIFALATKFHWTPDSAVQETKMLNPEKIKEKVPGFAKALSQRHEPEEWELVMNKTAQMMLELGNGKALTAEDFKKIEHKVLIAVGTADSMVSLTESEEVAQYLPNATFKSIADWTHPIEKVDIKLLSELLNDYFMA